MIQHIKFLKSFGLVLLIILIGFLKVNAQKAEPETEFKYVKNSDNSRTLTYSVKIKKDNGDMVPAEGIAVAFKSGDQKLATVNTNGNGLAKYIVPAATQINTSGDDKLEFEASIEPNKVVEPKSDKVSLKDVEIQMECKVVDSVKKVFFKGFMIGTKGEKVPIPKTDFNFYVPRMFSMLKIAEGSFGEDGTGEIEVPSGLPGDSLGNITILGRIEENADYQNVVKEQVVQWGVPTIHHMPKFQRALWTAVAPTWMIVTLTILLFGVWAHYIFVIYKLWKIKQESRREA